MRLILYTRPGCHLCEVLKDQVRELPPALRARLPELEVVDISTDPDLETSFGRMVPVLMLGGKVAARGRVSDRVLRGRLRDLLSGGTADRPVRRSGS